MYACMRAGVHQRTGLKSSVVQQSQRYYGGTVVEWYGMVWYGLETYS